MAGFQVQVRSNSADVIAELLAIGKDKAPLATAKALTFTAERVRDAVQAQIDKVFDRPTPYTRRALYLRTAKPERLSAMVKIKDEASKGNAAVKYLFAQVYGGRRAHKRFEQALIHFGLMASNMYAVPGDRAALDGYGNIRASLIVQILSALGAGERTLGYMANRTARSAKKGRKKDYFVGRPGNGNGPLGIWQRVSGGARPIIIFVKAPTYRQRLDFYGIAERVAITQFPIIHAQQMKKAGITT